MHIDKLLETVKNAENKSNKDLIECETVLFDEFNRTKELIIDLTRHLESVEDEHKKVIKELTKRGLA
jgi:hypothetical protein